MVPVPYRVAERRQETHDSWTLELEPHGDEALEPLAPGQFAMLYAFGKGEVPISVSALPLIHTIRAVGTVSSALCDSRRGDILGWSWLFPPYRTMFDARALGVVRTLAFDAACLRGKCEQDHTLGYELLGRFAPVMLGRLQATRLQLMDVYGSAA